MSIEDARKDIQEISQGEFGIDIKITNLVNISVNLKGLTSLHHLGINPEDGTQVNTKNVHCSLSEVKLNSLGYVTRNVYNEVDLRGHKVEFKNALGITGKYRINETYPNETTGLIVCILGYNNG